MFQFFCAVHEKKNDEKIFLHVKFKSQFKNEWMSSLI